MLNDKLLCTRYNSCRNKILFSYEMKNTAKNIKATLQLFGYEDLQQEWFMSKGSGIVTYPQEPFRADFYVYAICISGKAQLRLNNKEILVKPDSFIAAIPSTAIQVMHYTENFTAKVLVFERGFLLKNILDTRQLEHLGFFSYKSLTFVHFKKHEAHYLCKLFDNLFEKSIQQSLFQKQIVQSLIFNLLFETANIYAIYYREKVQKALNREEELFIKFIKLVNFNHASQQQLSFYAQKLFISNKYLIQICKNITGKTPGTLIAEAQINEAKLLLSNPDNNVGMVSDSLGYASIAAFSKFFKKHTGRAPSQWRK